MNDNPKSMVEIARSRFLRNQTSLKEEKVLFSVKKKTWVVQKMLGISVVVIIGMYFSSRFFVNNSIATKTMNQNVVSVSFKEETDLSLLEKKLNDEQKKHVSFMVSGQIKSRAENCLVLLGFATVDCDMVKGFPEGLQLEKGSFLLKDFDERCINHFVYQGEAFYVGQQSCVNGFGQQVMVNIYSGKKPLSLANAQIAFARLQVKNQDVYVKLLSPEDKKKAWIRAYNKTHPWEAGMPLEGFNIRKGEREPPMPDWFVPPLEK